LTKDFFYGILNKNGGVFMAKVLLTDYTAVKNAANTLYEAIHKTSYTWVNNPSVGTKATAA
jgi:hypothetical protein